MDLTNLANLIVALLGCAGLALVVLLAMRSHAGRLQDAVLAHRAAIEQGLEKAALYALHHVADKDGDGRFVLDTHTWPKWLEEAIGFAADKIPDALAHFGIDPTTAAGREKLEDMLQARLGALSVARPQ